MVIFSEVSLDGLILTANQAILAAAVTKHSEKKQEEDDFEEDEAEALFFIWAFFLFKGLGYEHQPLPRTCKTG